MKKGISLIVLVITIIIIIILAAAVIISLQNNNPMLEANEARYQSDRDNMQSIFTNAVGKIMVDRQDSIIILPGQINKITIGPKQTTGDVVYKSSDGLIVGKITFDDKKNEENHYYTGKKLPLYKQETIWHVDDEGILRLQIDRREYGDTTIKDNVPIENYIVYNANGGENAPATQNSENLIISEEIPIREKYVFLGWGLSNDTKEITYNPGDKYSGNHSVILYAIWREKVILEINEDTENINTSAKVTSISNNIISLDFSTKKVSELTGDYKVGNRIMLYASNTNNISQAGKYEIYTIDNISSNKITLNNKVDTTIFTGTNSQAINIPIYDDVVIGNNVILKASEYDGNCGGTVVIDVGYDITLNGKIDVSGCGYDGFNTAPNNGGFITNSNSSSAGGSNKHKGRKWWKKLSRSNRVCSKCSRFI